MEQFSFQIKSRTSQKTWNSSEIMCYLPTVMYGFSNNSGNHSLNGQQFHMALDRHNNFTTKIWPLGPKQLLILPKFCLPRFNFLRIEILELIGTKHLWAYVHLNARNKLSVMNGLVQLLYSLRQVFLTFFCAMDPF